MEVIPHFYVNLILSIDEEVEEFELGEIIEVNHASKWNQITNILDDERFLEYKKKLTLFNSIKDWEEVAEGNFGERFDIVNALLTKQGISSSEFRKFKFFLVIRRIIDCCAESPAMPDFCLSWFKLFQTFTQLFPVSFILHHVQPHVTFELGLFKADYNFNTLLLPCYTGEFYLFEFILTLLFRCSGRSTCCKISRMSTALCTGYTRGSYLFRNSKGNSIGNLRADH